MDAPAPDNADFLTGGFDGRRWFDKIKEIPFKPPVPVDQSTLNSSKYNFNYRVFPADLGDEHTPHYMVININVPVYSGWMPRTKAGEKRSEFDDRINGNLLNEASKVDRLRFGTNNPSGTTPTGGRNGAFMEIPRYTRRIAESIALFMPQSLVYSSQNAYEDISLTAIAGQIGVGALTGLLSVAGRSAAASTAASAIGAVGGVLGQAARLTGYPINPRIEIMFATTPQRQFIFEILMAPRNAVEAQAIHEIIFTLRYHAAPEIDSLTKGLTFIPPAEFDITFFFNGTENFTIPRINTCVLERIDVDYAPTGVFATFYDGNPVTVRLSMGFREIEVLHKKRITQLF